jgi:hypothetical protein
MTHGVRAGPFGLRDGRRHRRGHRQAPEGLTPGRRERNLLEDMGRRGLRRHERQLHVIDVKAFGVA